MSLRIKNLSKHYGEQRAVNVLNFHAERGEIVGFLGPNGAGKSTTMKIATGYIAPTEGTVEVCGKDVRTQLHETRKHIGYLPEHNPLYLDLYVHESLHFVAGLHGLSGKKAKTRVQEMVERVGLTREQYKKVGALSKGYRQRVGLAQALLHDPEVLILDEPTTGLDPNQIVEIRDVIQGLKQDKAVVLSTHIMQEVEAICDRVVIINRGEMVANAPVKDLLGGTQSRLFVRFEASPEVEILQQLPFVQQVEKEESHFTLTCHAEPDPRAQLFHAAVASGWVILEMQQEVLRLEQVFQGLTQKEKL